MSSLDRLLQLATPSQGPIERDQVLHSLAIELKRLGYGNGAMLDIKTMARIIALDFKGVRADEWEWHPEPIYSPCFSYNLLPHPNAAVIEIRYISTIDGHPQFRMNLRLMNNEGHFFRKLESMVSNQFDQLYSSMMVETAEYFRKAISEATVAESMQAGLNLTGYQRAQRFQESSSAVKARSMKLYQALQAARTGELLTKSEPATVTGTPAPFATHKPCSR